MLKHSVCFLGHEENVSTISYVSTMFRCVSRETAETISFLRKHGNFDIPCMFRFGPLGNGNVSAVSVETKGNFDP